MKVVRVTRYLLVRIPRTHIVTPSHIIDKSEPKVDEIPFDIIIGKCKMLKIQKSSYEEITVEDFENCGIEVKKGDKVIINTGWYKEWNTQRFYLEHPYLKKEAAQWLVNKGVTCVLMDLPFPDNPRDKIVAGELRPIQYIFFSQNVFLCKNLTNLDEIKCCEFELISLPVKIKDLSGAPTRILAVAD